jgi:hypothetical protein
MELLFPRRGNFIALAGNSSSKALLRNVPRLFGLHSDVLREAVTLPTPFPGHFPGQSDRCAGADDQ